MPFVKAILIGLIFLSLQSCQTVPLEKTFIIKANTIVIFPAESLHKELDRFSEDVQIVLSEKMKKKNFNVVLVSVEEYQQLRKEALTISGSMYEPSVGKLAPLNRNAFVKALVDLTSEKYAYDVIIVPDMVLRSAETQGDQGVWDGVKRDFSWVEKPKEIYRLPAKATGLSLRLGAYTNNGGNIVLNYTGVSLPYDLLYNTLSGKFGFQLKDVFFTKKELNESVELALLSFFAQVKYYEK
jgi:hypothetical protein